MPDMSRMPSRGFSIGVSESKWGKWPVTVTRRFLMRTVLPVPTNSAAPSKPGKLELGPAGLAIGMTASKT